MGLRSAGQERRSVCTIYRERRAAIDVIAIGPRSSIYLDAARRVSKRADGEPS